MLALISTAMAAFQPKVTNMKAEVQFQVDATIKIGGAAKEVSVPPIETFTNRTPSARYFKRSGTSGRKICGANMSAAIVMAAGSVIADPKRGTAAKPNQAVASELRTGSMWAMALTVVITKCSTGLDAAITITTNTNSGSVYLRDSA